MTQPARGKATLGFVYCLSQKSGFLRVKRLKPPKKFSEKSKISKQMINNFTNIKLAKILIFAKSGRRRQEEFISSQTEPPRHRRKKIDST